MISSKTNRMDQLGMTLSAACGVHCLAMPVVLLFAPAAFHSLEGELFHSLMFVAVILVGGWSFTKSYGCHQRKSPLVLGLCGVLILAVSLVLPHSHSLASVSMGTAVTLVGSTLMIVAHALNIHRC